MEISAEAFEQCIPLLEGFLDDMQIVVEFRVDLFGSTNESRTLFSETLRVFAQYQTSRCRGVYALLADGLPWDAEVLLRAFYEAVAKTYYIATAPVDRRDQIVTEFWEVLPAIYDPKGADRATVAEKLAQRQGRSDDERVFSFLRSPSSFNLKRIHNKKYRDEVERRWSFSKIVEVLSRGLDGHQRIASLDAMLHGYGMASHIAHASPKAFDLLEDRATRTEHLALLECSHIARTLLVYYRI